MRAAENPDSCGGSVVEPLGSPSFSSSSENNVTNNTISASYTTKSTMLFIPILIYSSYKRRVLLKFLSPLASKVHIY